MLLHNFDFFVQNPKCCDNPLMKKKLEAREKFKNSKFDLSCDRLTKWNPTLCF